VEFVNIVAEVDNVQLASFPSVEFLVKLAKLRAKFSFVCNGAPLTQKPLDIL
jgi:hypothetical protein